MGGGQRYSSGGFDAGNLVFSSTLTLVTRPLHSKPPPAGSMSEMAISQHLWVFAVIQLSFWFARRLDSHFEPSAKSTSSMVIVCFLNAFAKVSISRSVLFFSDLALRLYFVWSCQIGLSGFVADPQAEHDYLLRCFISKHKFYSSERRELPVHVHMHVGDFDGR